MNCSFSMIWILLDISLEEFNQYIHCILSDEREEEGERNWALNPSSHFFNRRFNMGIFNLSFKCIVDGMFQFLFLEKIKTTQTNGKSDLLLLYFDISNQIQIMLSELLILNEYSNNKNNGWIYTQWCSTSKSNCS